MLWSSRRRRALDLFQPFWVCLSRELSAAVDCPAAGDEDGWSPWTEWDEFSPFWSRGIAGAMVFLSSKPEDLLTGRNEMSSDVLRTSIKRREKMRDR